MSLELRVSSDGHLESRQGFICFSWRSPFQRYVDSCHLVSKLMSLYFSVLLDRQRGRWVRVVVQKKAFRALRREHLNCFVIPSSEMKQLRNVRGTRKRVAFLFT